MWKILIVLVLIELAFSPRLEITRNKDLLLFYGRRSRKYIKLF